MRRVGEAAARGEVEGAGGGVCLCVDTRSGQLHTNKGI